MTGSAIAPGWYQLPNDPPDAMRYWDGFAWSEPHQLPPDAQSADPFQGSSPFQTPAASPQFRAPQTAQFQPAAPPTARQGEAAPGGRSHRRGPQRSSGQVPHPVSDQAAPLAKRLIARVADLVIQWALYLLLLLPSDAVSVGHVGFYLQLPGWSTASAIWAIITGIMVFWVWEFAWVSQRSATPGKILFGLLVAERSTGPSSEQVAWTVPPSPQAAAIRIMPRVFYGIPVAGLIVWIAESLAGLYLMVRDTTNRLTLNDQVSSTKIVVDQSARHPNRPVAAGLVVAAVTLGLVTGGTWYFLHRPALAAATAVLDDITDNNLAEATSAFASSCDVDRLRYADYFTRNQMLDFALDRVEIDWALPLLSDEGDRTEAIVTGGAVVTGEIEGRQRVNLLLIRDEGWRVCRFLNE